MDVATGQLPQVSWIVTQFLESEHPAAPPAWGSYALADILQTLIKQPDVWEKTAVVVSYDENGGFFDHVPPPVAPPGTAGEYLTVPLGSVPAAAGVAGPIGLGFRVPCLILSPYSRGGLVYSGVSDHTSQLRLLEARFGVPVPNLSGWRRSVVGNLTGAFDFASSPVVSAPALPATSLTDPLVLTQGVTNGAQASLAQGAPYPVPPNSMPRQEAGPARRRPSGPVCATAARPPTAGPTSTTSTTATTAVPTESAGPGPAARSGGDNTLPATGATVQELVTGAIAMGLLGAVTTGLAAEFPATRDPAATRPTDE